jgi:hypothetical protein
VSYLAPQVYASGAPSSWRERQRAAQGLFALAELAAATGARRPAVTWMEACNVVLCPLCRAGVCWGSRCRGCGRVAALPVVAVIKLLKVQVGPDLPVEPSVVGEPCGDAGARAVGSLCGEHEGTAALGRLHDDGLGLALPHHPVGG